MICLSYRAEPMTEVCGVLWLRKQHISILKQNLAFSRVVQMRLNIRSYSSATYEFKRLEVISSNYILTKVAAVLVCITFPKLPYVSCLQRWLLRVWHLIGIVLSIWGSQTWYTIHIALLHMHLLQRTHNICSKPTRIHGTLYTYYEIITSISATSYNKDAKGQANASFKSYRCN